VFEVYGRRCQDCGRSDVALEVHHANGDPMDNRIMNTIPLCRDCHHGATFPGISSTGKPDLKKPGGQ
jgi:5-methylcytosine-specific restriction endonuclease McrA